MAPKKKDKTNEAIDLQSAARIADRNKAFLERRHDDIFGEDLAETTGAIDAFDKEVKAAELDGKESLMNLLKEFRLSRGGVGVRVMQVGSDGRFTDVSDKVKPEDLRPEDIRGIQTESGRVIGRTPQSREDALELLRQMAANPGRLTPGFTPRPQAGKSVVMREMELVLEASDKILEHWKK